MKDCSGGGKKPDGRRQDNRTDGGAQEPDISDQNLMNSTTRHVAIRAALF